MDESNSSKSKSKSKSKNNAPMKKDLSFLQMLSLLWSSAKLLNKFGFANIAKVVYSALREDYSAAVNRILTQIGRSPIVIEIPDDPTRTTTLYDRVINMVLLSDTVVAELSKPDAASINKHGTEYQAFKTMLLATKLNIKGNLMDSLVLGDLTDTKLTQDQINELERTARELGNYEHTPEAKMSDSTQKLLQTLKGMAIGFNCLNHIIPVVLVAKDGTKRNTHIWSLLFEKIFFIDPASNSLDLQLSMKDIEFMFAVVIYIMMNDKRGVGLAEKNPLNALYDHTNHPPELTNILNIVLEVVSGLVSNENIYKYLLAILGLNTNQIALNAHDKYNRTILSPANINKLNQTPIRSFSAAINFVYEQAFQDFHIDFLHLNFFKYILNQHNTLELKYTRLADLATSPEPLHDLRKVTSPTTAYKPIFLSDVMKSSFNKADIYNSPYYEDTIDSILYSGKYPLFSQFLETLSIDRVFTAEQRETISKFKVPAPHTLYIIKSLAPELGKYFNEEMGIFRMVLYVLPYLIPKPSMTIDLLKFAKRIYNVIKGDAKDKPLDFKDSLPIFNELFRRLLYIIEHKNILTSQASTLRRIILASNVYMNVTTLGIKYMLHMSILPDVRLDIGDNAYAMITAIAQKVSTLVYTNTPATLNTLLQPLYAFLTETDILAANTDKYFTDDEFVMLGKMLNYYTSLYIYETEKAMHTVYKSDELESPCLTQTESECGTMDVPVHIASSYTPGMILTPFTKPKIAKKADPDATCRWSKSKKRCVPRMQADMCSKYTTKATCIPDKVASQSLWNKITRKSKKRDIARPTDNMCLWDNDLSRCEVRDITKVRVQEKLAELDKNHHIKIYNFLRHLFTYTMRVSHLTLEQALDFTVADGVMYCEETVNLLNLINTARPTQVRVYVPNPAQKIYLLHIA
jgi:hypothetical protein